MVSSLLARCIIVTIGTLYPAYRSYKSLINSDLREVVNCLRYWVVFALFIAIETITDIILSWFPFYYWIKIGIVLWISSPPGSTFIYKRCIQPLLKDHEQEIDQLIEHSKKQSYSAILDLTNKGIRYASNVFLNTAVLGQSYLGEHLKRSLSTSDINRNPTRNVADLPATVQEESEEETDPEFTSRLKEDRKYLSKGSNRKPLARDSSDNQLDDYEMSKVLSRKGRNAAATTTATKRSGKGTKVKQEVIDTNDTDDEIENMRKKQST